MRSAWLAVASTKIKAAPMGGATVVANELNAWISVSITDSLPFGANSVTYGLPATCSNTIPEAKINSAPKKIG